MGIFSSVARGSIKPPLLSSILENRRWLRRSDPFPHFVARSVFTPNVYRELENAFQSFLSRGFGTPGDTTRFSRSMGDYDAYALHFPPNLSGPFRIFLSRPWHDMLAMLAGLEATGDINVGLHHHMVGSADGRIHNDLNPGWFVEGHGPEGINVLDTGLWSYSSGRTYKPGLVARETVRAVAMIFYLSNPAWSPGDGGETGLYHDVEDSVYQAAAIVPPINNSALVFECTPYSYHSFLANRQHPRNSLIMWLHRPKDEVVARWADRDVVNWS